MPLGKRKSYVQRGRAAMVRGRVQPLAATKWGRKRLKTAAARGSVIQRRVNQLYSMIETKDSTQTLGSNISLNHNTLTVHINPFTLNQGTGDPMAGTGSRIGDKISVKGLMIRGFVECALNRPKVFFRVMLVKMAKGDTLNTANLFKGDSGNKMIDQVNTERFTVLAQKIFTVEASNAPAAVTVNLDGTVATGNPGGIGTRTFKMWIPGTKFGRDGNVQYEDASTSQVKFYDYRVCTLVYDWYGTPDVSNTVGRMNSLYTKLYFKDA